jgi:hypothetical protein
VCACEGSYVCARCRDDDKFASMILDTTPVTLAEWDYLVMCEQNETAEPFKGRTW